MKYIDNKFLIWLKELLKSSEVDLYPIHQIVEFNCLNKFFKTKISESDSYRNSPISKSQGLLIFKNCDNEQVLSEFIQVVKDSIEKKDCSSKGLTNYLILIDRLGSITESMQYDLVKVICELIPEDLYSKMILNFIYTLNNEYKFSNIEEFDFDSPKQWGDLMSSVQYLDHFNDPIDIFRWVINFKPRKISLIDILHELNPDPKVSLIEYGIKFDFIEEELINYLSEHKREASFYVVLLVQNSSRQEHDFSSRLAKYFVKNHWKNTGIYLLNSVFGKPIREIEINTLTILKDVLNELLTNQFSSNKNSIKLIEMNWPNDFLALGGWFNYLNEIKLEFTFSQEFIDDLSLTFSNILKKTNSYIPLFINGDKKIYSYWYSDAFEIRAQYFSAFTMWAIEKCSDNIWKEILSNFKSISNQIKLLFYGSYTAVRLAQDISNKLLCILLTSDQLNNSDELPNNKRVTDLFEIFINSLGRQWTIFIEREKLIWNSSNHKAGISDTDLLFIIKKIQKKDCKNMSINLIKQNIQSNSTFEWPIFDLTE